MSVRQNLPFTAKFWANDSISLEKSPLSNILPVHDKIHVFIIMFHDQSRSPTTPCDLHDLQPKILGSRHPNPYGPRNTGVRTQYRVKDIWRHSERENEKKRKKSNTNKDKKEKERR